MSNLQIQNITATKSKFSSLGESLDELFIEDAEDRWEGDGGHVWLSPESSSTSQKIK